MTVVRNTPVLDALLGIVADLGGTYELEASIPGEDARKLAFLKAGGRDFLVVTPQVQQAALRKLQASLPRLLTQAGNIKKGTALDEAAEAAGAVVVKRFVEQRGYGMPWKPLRESTIRSKRARGGVVASNATKVGVATGDLLAALENAAWHFVKK